MIKSSLAIFALTAATMVGCANPSASATGDDEVASSSDALTSTKTVRLTGNWVNSDYCVFTTGDPATPGPFACNGPTTFTGGMVGSSRYYATGTILPDFDYLFTMTETFTVRLSNRDSGSFNMVEAAYIDAANGNLSITGFIAGGTGCFRNARGVLSFPGVSDANGIGQGTYNGSITY